MDKTILVTGATGFLGSHLCNFFIEKEYNVIGLKRSTSDSWRCANYFDKVKWVDSDINHWEEQVIMYNPHIIIHTAWEGVTSVERGDLCRQLKNLDLIGKLLSITNRIQVEKIIGLGSQAEYGFLRQVAVEEQQTLPNDAYGQVKILVSELIKLHCLFNSIQWYWMRVFSVFGENESDTWLIPSILKKVVNHETKLDFSPATQKISYMHTSDFVKLIEKVVNLKNDASGIYNLSGQSSIELRKIIERVVELSKYSSIQLNFGALPFRNNQSMLIQGNMDKFSKSIDKPEYNNFDSCLKNVVDYYVKYYTGSLN